MTAPSPAHPLPPRPAYRPSGVAWLGYVPPMYEDTTHTVIFPAHPANFTGLPNPQFRSFKAGFSPC